MSIKRMTRKPPPMSEIEKIEGFRLRRWEVTVNGYDSSVSLATTRGKALADAWRCDAFNGVTFGEFLKFARCHLSKYKPERFGDPITVCGKPAFFVGNNRQYVQIAYPGGEFPLSAHPYDVEPEEYRPDTYRHLKDNSK